LGDQTKKDESGRACAFIKKRTRFEYTNPKERDHLEDLNTDKIHNIKMDVKEIRWDGV
jgi:hypothetical protein